MAVIPPLVFHPIYSQLELPYRHRFPIEKYQGIFDALCGQGVPAEAFITPRPVPVNRLLEYYDNTYVNALLHGTLERQPMRRIGFPWSEQLIRRSLTAVGGTIETARLALQHGIALNLTGGYHHAAGDFGAGFCLFNDLYLAARQMLTEPGIDSVLIIDLDVHQGDGTALLAQNDPAVITLSLHGEKNFPHRKQHSDMDFPLPKAMGDDDYLNVLDEALTAAQRLYTPDAIIYDAGVDIHKHDDLGLLDISTQGVFNRDQMVFNWCQALDLPVAAVIGGGYQRDIDALVAVHLQLYRAAGVIA